MTGIHIVFIISNTNAAQNSELLRYVEIFQCPLLVLYLMTCVCLPALKVSHLSSLIKEKDQLIDEKCDMLLKQKEELDQLSQG